MPVSPQLRDRARNSATVPRTSRSPKASVAMARQNVRQLPSPSRRLPAELRSLQAVQKISSAIAFCLVASTLGVYAWSVCIPRLWSQEYRRLETLQRNERHLTAMGETIKNQLAQQAERPETGLASLNPGQVIFLSPTSISDRNSPLKATANRTQSTSDRTPLAY